MPENKEDLHMLEKIDLNKTVDKKSYRKVMDEASQRLGLLQRE